MVVAGKWGPSVAVKKVAQSYSLDIGVVEELRRLSSATEIPASRLANRALTVFIREQKSGGPTQ
jgi:hypothetical protein